MAPALQIISILLVPRFVFRFVFTWLFLVSWSGSRFAAFRFSLLSDSRRLIQSQMTMLNKSGGQSSRKNESDRYCSFKAKCRQVEGCGTTAQVERFPCLHRQNRQVPKMQFGTKEKHLDEC